MDKYVLLVFLLAPGFIARGVALRFGDFPRKKNEIDAIMSYFSYSFFAVLTSFLIAPAFGIYRYDESIPDVIEHLTVSGIAVRFSCIALVTSILVGALWAAEIRDRLLSCCNGLLKRMGRNEIYLNNSLQEKLFADGKSHFVALEKDGVEKAVGFVQCVNSADSTKCEFSIIMHPNYESWYKRAKEDEKLSFHYPKLIYFDFDEGIIIKEYNYPTEWEQQQKGASCRKQETPLEKLIFVLVLVGAVAAVLVVLMVRYSHLP